MLGHNVRVRLTSPDEEVKGELRQQDATGVWVYHGWADQAKLHFYPMHRVVQISDNGHIYR